MGRDQSNRNLAIGTGALVAAGCAHHAFVQPAASLQPRLRAISSAATPDSAPRSELCGAALPGAAFAALAAAAAGAGARAAASSTARRAAVKKKGVRVVEGKEIPWNLFSPKAPYKGSVVSKETITTKTDLVNWETCHVVMNHDKKVPYVEGQSIGIIAPGPDKKGQTPAKIRLYSIASSACGDDETYETVSLVVKRVLEVSGRGWCEYSNVEPGTDKEFPDAEKVYRGVCSSHICDLEKDDDVLITGPTGAEMLLPDDPKSNIIMLATGTGIAPFRSFLRKLFHDKATKGKFEGTAWLFLGVPYSNSLLYDEEWKEMKSNFPDNFKYDYAVSDEMTTPDGKKMWVQHKVMEYKDQVWDMLKDPSTHTYMCGLKGMESGLQEAFEDKAAADGLEWKEFVSSMKKEKRYHVEVY
jgi:ferredoxin--NADP+ reductase